MTKSKLMCSLVTASALALGWSVAFADTEHDAFFQRQAKLSPSAAKTLSAVGTDSKQKCGAEPTVAQYKAIASDSPAYAFRLAVTVLANGDVNGWAPKQHAIYEGYLREVDCASLQSRAGNTPHPL